MISAPYEPSVYDEEGLPLNYKYPSLKHKANYLTHRFLSRQKVYYTNPTGFIDKDYYFSLYGAYFSSGMYSALKLKKNYSNKRWIKYLNTIRYCETNYEFTLASLVKYYSDIKSNFYYYSLGNYDPLINNLYKKLAFLSVEYRFDTLMFLWEECFSYALERFINIKHKTYSESLMLTYEEFFFEEMSKIISSHFFTLTLYSNDFIEKTRTPILSFDSEIEEEDQPTVPLKTRYQEENYYSTLVVRSFSPSLLSIF